MRTRSGQVLEIMIRLMLFYEFFLCFEPRNIFITFTNTLKCAVSCFSFIAALTKSLLVQVKTLKQLQFLKNQQKKSTTAATLKT